MAYDCGLAITINCVCVLRVRACHQPRSSQVMFIAVCMPPVFIRPQNEMNTNAVQSIRKGARENHRNKGPEPR